MNEELVNGTRDCRRALKAGSDESRKSPDELTHHCFRARVGQILVNLLGNASDAFDEAGTQAPTIRIKVQRSTSNQPLRLEVSDNGPGIPPDIQARIFEKFYTTKEAGKEQF